MHPILILNVRVSFRLPPVVSWGPDESSLLASVIASGHRTYSFLEEGHRKRAAPCALHEILSS